MRRSGYVFLSFALIAGLSTGYGFLLRWWLSWDPASFLAWCFFTLIEAFFILTILGAYYFYPPQKPSQAIPYETFKANYESGEPITQELEIPTWAKK